MKNKLGLMMAAIAIAGYSQVGFSQNLNLVSRTDMTKLGINSFKPHYLTLDDNRLAVHETTGNGVVHILKISESGEFSKLRTISSPDQTRDWASFGDSVIMDGNLLGIGSSHTVKHNPHDGRFYIYDLSTGVKKTDFNPDSHAAQYFGYADYSNKVLAVQEGGNQTWGTDAAVTFYRMDGFKPTQLFRYVLPGNASVGTARISASGDFFITSFDNYGNTRHLFVWKVIRDNSGKAIDVEQFAKLVETGTPVSIVKHPNRGSNAINGKYVAVGIPNAKVNGVESGAVSILKINMDGTLKRIHRLVPPDAAGGMKFGYSAAFKGDYLFVSSPEAQNGSSGKGKVYIYHLPNDDTAEVLESFYPSNSKTGETFGSYISISADRMAIAAGSKIIYLYDVSEQGLFHLKYQMIEGNFTWDEAKSDAEKRGGHLATITSKVEQDIITALVSKSKSNAWLGGTDEGSEGNWKWITGESWEYQNWEDGEPNGGQNENHLNVWGTSAGENQAGGDLGTWNDFRDYYRMSYILEIPRNLQQGLVAYYPFNGNANDESGNGNHGEVIGAELSTDRHGKKNAAYKFDGSNDYISLGTAERYTEKLSGSLTLSAWFNASKHHHGVIFQFGEGIDGRANQVIGIGLETGRILANIRGANGEGAGTRFVYTDTDVHDTKWHHIVLVKEENNYNYLYLDGDLVFSEKDTSGSINPISSDIVHVGRALSGNGYNAYFNGYIDDLRMYSIALTGSEVVGMYELEKPETVIPPQITAISENTVADEGETIELTVVADGEGPLLYSWKKTGSNVELSNTTNLVLSNVDEGDAGSYYVVVSNEGGKTDSATVEIDIRPDTDNDGLLDYEEIALGSDINKADTDGDGLSDFDEVDLFSTSPIRPDTDGDGLDDGSEIRGGFDPRKPTESADGSISIKVAVELEFFTLTWNNYQLQRSKDLIQWQDVDAPFKGVGGYSSILQTARKDKIYWRLKIID